MVLFSLASSLREALSTDESTDESEAVSIKAVCAALLRADVDASTVHGIRQGIRERLRRWDKDVVCVGNAANNNPNNNHNNSNNNHKRTRRRSHSVREALQAELAGALECDGGASLDSTSQRRNKWMPPRRHGRQRRPGAGAPGPSIVMLVGLQGAGKTTSASKLIALYRRKGLRVAAVAADVFRAGAVDQLQQNCARIGGVSVFSDKDCPDAASVLRKALRAIEEGEEGEEGGQEGGQEEGKVRGDAKRSSPFDVVVVDTAGRHAQDDELTRELAALVAVRRPDACYLVVDGTQGGSAVGAHAASLRRSCPLSGVIVSKLDSASAGGGALTASVAAGVPVRFVGTGERLGDLQEFDTATFVRRLLGETKADVGAFDRWASEIESRRSGSRRRAAANKTKISKKKKASRKTTTTPAADPAEVLFTLRDVREQYQAMLAPGVSIAQGLSCLAPSSWSGGDGGEGGAESEQEVAVLARMRRFLVLTDSCTEEELSGGAGSPSQWAESRVRRVARGCGFPLGVVASMLGQAVRLQAIATQMEATAARREFGAKQQRELGARIQATSPGLLEGIGGHAGLRAMLRRR